MKNTNIWKSEKKWLVHDISILDIYTNCMFLLQQRSISYHPEQYVNYEQHLPLKVNKIWTLYYVRVCLRYMYSSGSVFWLTRDISELFKKKKNQRNRIKATQQRYNKKLTNL
jgi:hypothetical protein